MNSRPEVNAARGRALAVRAMDCSLDEDAFHRIISIERRRAARSRKSFLLMLLDMGEHSTSQNHGASLRKILSTLTGVLRETDVTGWYKEDSIVGVMFTEITLDDESSISATMINRVSQALKKHLSPQQFGQIGISFHLLPEVRNHGIALRSPYPAVYPGVAAPTSATGTSL